MIYTEQCACCDAEIPAHDSGLCLTCEEALLEPPEDLVEVEKSWLEAERQGIQEGLEEERVQAPDHAPRKEKEVN